MFECIYMYTMEPREEATYTYIVRLKSVMKICHEDRLSKDTRNHASFRSNNLSFHII